MKIVISPAKTLDYQSPLPTEEHTSIAFPTETEVLNQVLSKKTPKKLADLMHISQALAVLNHERNQTRTNEYSLENARQAIFAFKGEVYLGLDAYSLRLEQINMAQNKLRILSGLYGILKPLDLIQPYRLEMGTSLKVGRKANLYQYWGDKIAQYLNQELNDGEDLINLASQEYFGAVDLKKLKHRVITPIFKDHSNGQLKVISFFAKKARGLMVRFALDKQIENPQDLKIFNYENYEFDAKLSTDTEWVFVR